MSLNWFDRVCGELQDHLQSICDKYDRIGSMTVERGAKHPRIEFFTELDEDEQENFCALFFDPKNEEFYMESFDIDFGQISKVLLPDIEDIVEAVHETFHAYIEGDDEYEYEYESDNDNHDLEVVSGSVSYHSNGDDDSEVFEIDVEWETPEVTAYIKENEVEVTYQFGIVQETGDGLLRRVNRIWTDDVDIILRDETNFMFSKEEAGTIISMIASHMDSLSSMDE